MKLIILTQYYPPEHGAPQNRLHDLAKRFAAAGHDITVMTAMPNYPKGKVFPEYRSKCTVREQIDGVKVVRSWIFTSQSKGKFAQLTVYFSFVASSIFYGLFRLPKADFLICESPPLFLGFSALFLSFAKKAKLIMNISDLWPESAVQLGMIGPGPALTFLEWFEKLLYKKSLVVLGQTEGIVEGILKTSPGTEAVLFPNGVDLDMFPVKDKNTELAAEFRLQNAEFVVGYGGNHGRSQALNQVLEAAEIVAEKNSDIIFMLCGDGPEKKELIKQAEKKKLDNVRFIESQSREKMCEVQALWDIALVPLKNIELFDGARPSKMFELMAGRIPFIFCGKGEGAELALKSGCAEIVHPEKPDELAEKILRMAKMPESERQKMGGNGRKFVSENFNRAKLADMLMRKLSDKL